MIVDTLSEFGPTGQLLRRYELADDGTVTVTVTDDKGATVVVPPTADTAATAAAIKAAQTVDTNDRTIRQRLHTALDANAAFLALASPTNAQVLAQVRVLTRENTGLIRLALDALDAADGT